VSRWWAQLEDPDKRQVNKNLAQIQRDILSRQQGSQARNNFAYYDVALAQWQYLETRALLFIQAAKRAERRVPPPPAPPPSPTPSPFQDYLSALRFIGTDYKIYAKSLINSAANTAVAFATLTGAIAEPNLATDWLWPFTEQEQKTGITEMSSFGGQITTDLLLDFGIGKLAKATGWIAKSISAWHKVYVVSRQGQPKSLEDYLNQVGMLRLQQLLGIGGNSRSKTPTVETAPRPPAGVTIGTAPRTQMVVGPPLQLGPIQVGPNYPPGSVFSVQVGPTLKGSVSSFQVGNPVCPGAFTITTPRFIQTPNGVISSPYVYRFWPVCFVGGTLLHAVAEEQQVEGATSAQPSFWVWGGLACFTLLVGCLVAAEGMTRRRRRRQSDPPDDNVDTCESWEEEDEMDERSQAQEPALCAASAERQDLAPTPIASRSLAARTLEVNCGLAGKAPRRRLWGSGVASALGVLAVCLSWLLVAPWKTPSAPAPAARQAGVLTRLQPIETIRVGQKVFTDRPEAGLTADSEVDPKTWRLLRLRAQLTMPDGTDDPVEVETLQPPEWVRAHNAQPGKSVPLPFDLDEMGLPAGLRAVVVSNERCPSIPSGTGRVVLTTVNHLNPDVLELTIEDDQGRQEKIRPTGSHKFCRASDGVWVSARDLVDGEQIRGRTGLLRVQAKQRIHGVHRVYNLTVEGEHVYYVSSLGALAHNANCREPHYLEWELRGPRGGKIAKDVEFSGVEVTFPKGTKLTFPEQSWYGHTEGKVISNLIDAGQMRAGRVLAMEGILPPCPNCKRILQWSSEKFKMTIDYVDTNGRTWTWINGVLQK
jgi:hypothetical protein